MEGGGVLMLNVLSEITAPGTLKKIRVAINDDEETGSAHSKARLKELAQGLPYGLVYEPGLPGAALVTSLSGIRWLQLNVKGKAAHAGFEHQKGVNACVELGSKLVRLSALTQYSKAAGRNYFYD